MARINFLASLYFGNWLPNSRSWRKLPPPDRRGWKLSASTYQMKHLSRLTMSLVNYGQQCALYNSHHHLQVEHIVLLSPHLLE